ncbi:MAG: hypothetical protein CSA22_03910 [Deltaproteobacteria bacterium]|nr:MAG: hypothetical protein CSA22_03910 [Deltaproteobacteria bacterium]
MPGLPDITPLALRWGLTCDSLCPDCIISGSPQRTTGRWVFQTPDSRRFLLESIAAERLPIKKARIALLKNLTDAGLNAVTPYCTGLDGNAVQQYDGRWWQLMPYLENTPLKRPAYIQDMWRGSAMADFLVRLWQASDKLNEVFDTETEPLPDYIYHLMQTLEHREPRTAKRFTPIFRHLTATLFPIYPDLTAHLCHGDFHPLNIIWGKNRIRSVIDWEFSGARPVLYDAANLLGCIGCEDPEALTGPMAEGCITRLQKDPFFTSVSWDYLVDLTLALRFAWLSEWLRTHDREMIEMEADYMHLILNHRSVLLKCWTEGTDH